MNQDKLYQEFTKGFNDELNKINKILEPNFYKPLSWKWEKKRILEDFADDLTGDFFGFIKEKLNEAMHVFRIKRYQQLKKDFKNIRIVAEGDSWFQHPMVDDVIDFLQDDNYAVCCFSAAGDKLVDMAWEGEFMQAINTQLPKLFLLSGGGNDILSSEILTKIIDISQPDFINSKVLNTQLELLKDSINSIVYNINDVSPGLPILMHGYDYIIPRNDGSKTWIYPVLKEKQILDTTTGQKIIQHLIDEYNKLLIEFTKKYPGQFYHLDIRGILPDASQWYDEIHPNEESFRLITEMYKRKIIEILATKKG